MCPKCGSENVKEVGTEHVRHAIVDGKVEHVIEDAMTCSDCDAVFNVARVEAKAPRAKSAKAEK